MTSGRNGTGGRPGSQNEGKMDQNGTRGQPKGSQNGAKTEEYVYPTRQKAQEVAKLAAKEPNHSLSDHILRPHLGPQISQNQAEMQS